MQMTKEHIERLFRQHYPRMYQLALVLLKAEAASQDVVSDVFAEVLDVKVTLRPATESSYLLVCVRNKCLTLINRQKMKDRVHHLLQLDASSSILPPNHTSMSRGAFDFASERILFLHFCGNTEYISLVRRAKSFLSIIRSLRERIVAASFSFLTSSFLNG